MKFCLSEENILRHYCVVQNYCYIKRNLKITLIEVRKIPKSSNRLKKEQGWVRLGKTETNYELKKDLSWIFEDAASVAQFQQYSSYSFSYRSYDYPLENVFCDQDFSLGEHDLVNYPVQAVINMIQVLFVGSWTTSATSVFTQIRAR